MSFPFKSTYPTPTECSSGINSCEFIILHHTGTQEGTIKWVLDWLYKRADYASCHFVVDVNWDAYKIGNPTDILWHAGESTWNWKKDLNKYSMGIEIIWPLKNGGFTQAQRTTVKWLISHLMKVYNIPKENVLTHKMIAPKRKVDVDDSFWNNKFKTYKDYQNSLSPREWV